MQDITTVGQSVPHVNVHILPINYGDLDSNKKIYNRWEERAPGADHHPHLQILDVLGDDARGGWTVE